MSTRPPHDPEADRLGRGAVAGGIDRPKPGLERPGPEPPRPDLGAEPPLVRTRGPQLDEFADRPVATPGLALDRELDLRRLRQLVPEEAPIPDRAGSEP